MTASESQVVEVLLEIMKAKGLPERVIDGETPLDQLGLESLDWAQSVIRMEELTGKDPFASGEDLQLRTISDVGALYA